MLSVVLPIVAARSASAISVRVDAVSAVYAVAAVYVVAVSAVDIGVAVVIIVVVDGDVVVAAPTAAIAPATSPCRSHGQSHTEGNRYAGSVVARRRVRDGRIRINRRTIHDNGVIAWNVNNFGIGLLDDNDLLGFDHLGFYFLLLGRFQVSSVLGLFPHALNGVHHIALLGQKSVAEIGSPLDVIREALHYFREGSQALNARVPRLFGDRILERLVLQILILCQPLLELHEFQRIGGSGKNLGKHRVRIQGNGRDEGIKLVRRYLDSVLLFRRYVRVGFLRNRAVRLLLGLSSKRRAHLQKQKRAQYGESVLTYFLE